LSTKKFVIIIFVFIITFIVWFFNKNKLSTKVVIDTLNLKLVFLNFIILKYVYFGFFMAVVVQDVAYMTDNCK